MNKKVYALSHFVHSINRIHSFTVLQVIPAERRVPDKDETWTLPTDQQDELCSTPANPEASTSADPIQAKGGAVDAEPDAALVSAADSRDSSLPRGHETRKSKTRRVKSYLKKCKGALTSRTEDSSSVERRERNSNCTSWYVDDEAAAVQVGQDNDDEAIDGIAIGSRSADDDSPEAAGLPLPIGENEIGTSPEIVNAIGTSLEIVNEIGTSLGIVNAIGASLEIGNEIGTNLEIVDEIGSPDGNPRKDSGFSIYEDASDLVVASDRVGSRETLVLIEDSLSLNKCDSSDTLIADLPEIKLLDASVSGCEDDDKTRPTTAPATVSLGF